MSMMKMFGLMTDKDREKLYEDARMAGLDKKPLSASLAEALAMPPTRPPLSVPIPRKPEQPAPPPGPVKPKAVLAPPIERRHEYMALIEELQISCREVENLKLKALLHKHHMPIYDLTEVVAYLNSLIPPTAKNHLYVSWASLRPPHGHERESHWDAGRSTVYYHNLYTKTVPIHVLKRVKTLLADDQTLEFYVSEIRVNPDPFLMVKRPESDGFVIAAWDEPGFEGVPEIV